MNKRLSAVAVILWLALTILWAVNGREWWIPLGAAFATGTAFLAEREAESLRREVREAKAELWDSIDGEAEPWAPNPYRSEVGGRS